MAWKLEAVAGNVKLIAGKALPVELSVPAQYRKPYTRKVSADAAADFLNIAAQEEGVRVSYRVVEA